MEFHLLGEIPVGAIIITYFARSLIEMSISLLLNLVHLELRSVSESIQPN